MEISFQMGNYVMESIVIIGGGVAGLSCANALLDLGYKPLLIEAGVIGSPKMCGEFIAPSAVAQLKKWDLENIQHITSIVFHADKNCRVKLPNPAGAVERSLVELQLAQRAKTLGARVLENTKIKEVFPGSKNTNHLIQLVNGENIHARTLFIATGKVPLHATNNPHRINKSKFYGIKCHINRIHEHDALHMYNIPNGYYGIVPINATTSNFACLVKTSEIQKLQSAQQLFKQIQLPFSKPIIIDKWIEGEAPVFEKKSLPVLNNTYWIGDAIASFYPAIGSGFAHSVQSAVLAVNCYAKAQSNYQSRISKHIRPKIFIGQFLHQILHKKSLSYLGIRFLRIHPKISYPLLSVLGY
jgi:flavin-dependent dehydrogenase